MFCISYSRSSVNHIFHNSLHILSVPKHPGGICSSAEQADSNRRAETVSCRSAASHRDYSSLSLMEKHKKTRCEITHANSDYWQYIDSWNTLISTYVHGQVHTLTNLRKTKHIFPFPASAFIPSTCRQQKMKLFKAVMWKDRLMNDDEYVRLTRLPYLISETCDFKSGLDCSSV